MDCLSSVPGRTAILLALLIAVVGAPGQIRPPGLAAQSGVEKPVPRDPETGPRSFQHAQHDAVTCGVCHAVEQRHRSHRSWTPEDCAACHHGDAAPAGCTSCHARESLAAPRPVSMVLALSVWQGTEVRDLVFDHGRHARVGCLDCHQGGMTRPPESCASCHEHHQAAAKCADCHVTPAAAVHNLSVHLSCGGSGCHTAPLADPPMLSRTSCLFCHEEQREHRPGRSCAGCHVLPGSPRHE